MYNNACSQIVLLEYTTHAVIFYAYFIYVLKAAVIKNPFQPKAIVFINMAKIVLFQIFIFKQRMYKVLTTKYV